MSGEIEALAPEWHDAGLIVLWTLGLWLAWLIGWAVMEVKRG